MKLRNKKLSMFEQVLVYVFLGLTLIYFVLLIFGKYMFGAANEFYRSFNIFSNAANINIFVRIVSYTFFIFGISFVLRLIMKLILPLFKKLKGLLTIIISVIK